MLGHLPEFLPILFRSGVEKVGAQSITTEWLFFPIWSMWEVIWETPNRRGQVTEVSVASHQVGGGSFTPDLLLRGRECALLMCGL